MGQENIPYKHDDKLEAGSLTTNSRVLTWLDNFWYHYKWHTIIGGFFAIVLIVGLVQMLTRPSYDTMLVCAGGNTMTEEEKAALDELFCKLCPDDFNDDGEKRINLVMYQAYSDEELQKEKEQAEAESEHFVYDANHYAQEKKNFIFFTQTGEGAVCIVSPYLYENLSIEERLRELSTMYAYNEQPKGVTEDGKGVIWGETDLYIYYPAARTIPCDWIVCLLKPTINADENDYANSEELFRALVEYHVLMP